MNFKIKMSTMFLTICLIVCFLGCVVLGYMWIDRSISLAYLDKSYELSLENNRLSLLLENEWKGIPEQVLLKKLEDISKNFPKEEIVIYKDDESNVIVFDTIEFELESGKLKQINTTTRKTEDGDGSGTSVKY